MHDGPEGRGERAEGRLGQGTAGQLDESGGGGRGDRPTVPGLHGRSDHVRDTVQHGTVALAVFENRRPAHRLGVRRVLDAHHDPDGSQSTGETGIVRRRLFRQGAALGRPARGRPDRQSAVALRSRQNHNPAQVSIHTHTPIEYDFFFVEPKRTGANARSFCTGPNRTRSLATVADTAATRCWAKSVSL